MEAKATVPIPITPVLTSTQILPIIREEVLDPPTNIKATYSSSTQDLVYSCTITIPIEMTLSDVNFLQYYAGGGSNVLDFYFVYDYSGNGPLSGKYKAYDVKLTALNVNVDGTPIPLQSIKAIGSLIEDTDPKTSRGTVTSVRSISGTID